MHKVLITGGSGFLGKHLISAWPSETITLLGSTPVEGFENHILDIRVPFKLKGSFETVVHAAGKAHFMPRSESERQLFFDINKTGTANLLEALGAWDPAPKHFVLISTVAVYGLQKGTDIDEDHPLTATDPYGASKIEAEKMVEKWCLKNNVCCTILRLPLVCGRQPVGNLRKMIEAIRRKRWVHIGGGKARRSMVLAQDIAELIPGIVQIGGTYNLTDGLHPSYRELYQSISDHYKTGSAYNLPYPIALAMARVGDIWGINSPFNYSILQKMTSTLTFSDQKAVDLLNWQPASVVSHLHQYL